MGPIRNLHFLLLLPLAMAGLGAHAAEGEEARPSGPPSADYRLVWSDEFDGTELDSTKWDYRYLGPRRSAVNVRETVALDGEGRLVLTTRRAGDEIHTAMIGTQGKFEATFGYFECRVRLQRTHGNWSAFWLQSPTYGRVIDDPQASGTEIDIYECFKVHEGWVVHNVHWDGYANDHKHAGSDRIDVPGLSEGYHTFGLEWTPDEYIFYIDGEESWRTSQAVSHAREYIILSLEVGPSYAEVARQAEDFSDSVYFDYVRVYQKPE